MRLTHMILLIILAIMICLCFVGPEIDRIALQMRLDGGIAGAFNIDFSGIFGLNKIESMIDDCLKSLCN